MRSDHTSESGVSRRGKQEEADHAAVGDGLNLRPVFEQVNQFEHACELKHHQRLETASDIVESHLRLHDPEDFVETGEMDERRRVAEQKPEADEQRNPFEGIGMFAALQAEEVKSRADGEKEHETGDDQWEPGVMLGEPFAREQTEGDERRAGEY